MEIQLSIPQDIFNALSQEKRDELVSCQKLCQKYQVVCERFEKEKRRLLEDLDMNAGDQEEKGKKQKRSKTPKAPKIPLSIEDQALQAEWEPHLLAVVRDYAGKVDVDQLVIRKAFVEAVGQLPRGWKGEDSHPFTVSFGGFAAKMWKKLGVAVKDEKKHKYLTFPPFATVVDGDALTGAIQIVLNLIQYP